MIEAIQLVIEHMKSKTDNKENNLISLEVPLVAQLKLNNQPFLKKKKNTLPNRDYEDIVKILDKHFGFVAVRQKGSHIILEHPDGRHTVIPSHNPIKLGVIKTILSQIQVEEEEFLKY